MHVFKHPKFYEEYRKRAKLAQKELQASQEKEAISPKQSTDRGGRAPEDLSDKPQAKATSIKHQASGALSIKRCMWDQSSSAKHGVSRTSVSRPRIEFDP